MRAATSFYESPRAAREETDSVRRTLERLDLNYFIPCRVRDHTIAVLGLGKTVDGDFLTSEDVELLFTIAGYVAIALDNAQLYSSLEQKARANRAAEGLLGEYRRIAATSACWPWIWRAAWSRGTRSSRS